MGAEAEENQQGIEKTTTAANSNPNSITAAQFSAWKRRKDADASAKKDEAARKRAEDVAAGRVPMNGRELFEREPWLFDNTLY